MGGCRIPRAVVWQEAEHPFAGWHRSIEAPAGLPPSGSFPRRSRSDPSIVVDDLCSLYPASLFRPVLWRVGVFIVLFTGCAGLHPRVHFFSVELPEPTDLV